MFCGLLHMSWRCAFSATAHDLSDMVQLGGSPVGPASYTEVVYGERVLGRGLIPEPPEQAGEGLRQRGIPVPSPAPPNTVLLQALGQQHLATAQRASPAGICGQLRCSCTPVKFVQVKTKLQLYKALCID